MSTPLNVRGRLCRCSITMAEGNNENGVGVFDLDVWAIEHKLSRKTTGTLRKEEFESLASLKLVTSSDINRMDIAVGQLRLLRVALQALGNPIKLNDLAEEQEEDHEDGDQEAEVDDQDRNEGVLEDAGDHLAQLLDQGLDEEKLAGGDGDRGSRLPALKKKGTAAGTTYLQYDPLMHLTVKSGRKKALQIEQFLPDHVKTRVNRKKKEQLTFTTTPQGGLALKKDEPGSIYISVAEWNGANMRLCAHLLNKGLIRECELIYYMAYTAMVSDLTGRYEWVSVLEYDVRYRELQAEHGFPWGTPNPHIEMHMLIPRRVDFQGKGKTNTSHTRQQDRPRQKVDKPCHKWLARGECNFEDCIYRHDKPKTAASGAATSKNE